jgi:hypothetical protein
VDRKRRIDKRIELRDDCPRRPWLGQSKKRRGATSYNQPVRARRLNPRAPRGSAALRRAAPPKQGARPGWPRPCFAYRRPLAAIQIAQELRYLVARGSARRAKRREMNYEC